MRTASLRNLVLGLFIALLVSVPAGSAWQLASPAGVVTPTVVCDDTQCH